MSLTVEQFLWRLDDSGLKPLQKTANWPAELAIAPTQDAQRFADALVAVGKLTHFQAQAILKGRYQGLVLGDYALLDRIGAGDGGTS